MIQVKKIIYTPADIFAMFVTPQLVLPAPPAGQVNNIIGVSHDLVFATLAYTVATKILYGAIVSANNYSFGEFYLLAQIVNYNEQASKANYKQDPSVLSPNSTDCVFSTTKDFFVTTDLQAAAGNSNIDSYIIYEEKDIV